MRNLNNETRLKRQEISKRVKIWDQIEMNKSVNGYGEINQQRNPVVNTTKIGVKQYQMESRLGGKHSNQGSEMIFRKRYLPDKIIS